MHLQSINPVNGQLINIYETHTLHNVNEKISQTFDAWASWKQLPLLKRGDYLAKIAVSMVNNKDRLARLMALEMGKPVKAGVAEIEKCAAVCDYYAVNAAEFLKNEFIDSDASKSYVGFEPLGIVLAVMPWNFPFWQVFRFLAPTLVAGNCALLKHASNVPGCALAIEEIIKDSGLPDHVFQTLLIGSDLVNSVIESPLISAITLTGSVEAGTKVAAKAGSVLKKTVLELGGSDAYIILKDADLELAAETCVNSRLINSGQSCIAAKRFIVVKDISDRFIEVFKNKMASKIMGDPMDENTQIGPQATTELRDHLHQQVLLSIEKGAKCVLGGVVPEGKHAYYPPTVLTGVKKGMPAYDEELFGPVAAIITVNDETEAINIANDTIFGLGASVFSRNIERAEEIAAKSLQAGSCFVNDMVRSDPRLPFGGIKQSGYGRELSAYGIREFVNIKTVFIK
ncbi:NAD-dependent succinate-semialdehyde dehydrogenase [Flavihumibacter sp. R14]|nr:NAD-dependent succinate-semialdehyde dehydrogenase [Flavihumibacter soli]